ncbi:MAG: amidohydrolase family protein [Pigmentiphaga sp.]
MIDIHQHMVPETFRLAALAAGRGATLRRGFPPWSPKLAFELMDRQGIATAILSISQPGVHFGDDAQARTLARGCNELAAQCMADYPGRFGGFATLPLPDVAGACAEVRHALDHLQLDGVCLLANYDGVYLGDPTFEPVFQELDERGAVVFIHPSLHPGSRALDIGLPPMALEFPFDTTRAALQLIQRRHLQRYPRLRIILAHAGGTLPFLAWRLEMAVAMDSEAMVVGTPEIRDGLRRFWYDTALSSGFGSMRALSAIADPGRIVFGSDWPYGNDAVVARSQQALHANADLNPGQRAAIARGNALSLFPRLGDVSVNEA